MLVETVSVSIYTWDAESSERSIRRASSNEPKGVLNRVIFSEPIIKVADGGLVNCGFPSPRETRVL
jgi:hypothetical protein